MTSVLTELIVQQSRRGIKVCTFKMLGNCARQSWMSTECLIQAAEAEGPEMWPLFIVGLSIEFQVESRS